MFKRVFTYFSLFVICVGLVVSGGQSSVDIAERSALAPIMKAPQQAVWVDESSKKVVSSHDENNSVVSRAKALIVDTDMQSRNADVVIKSVDTMKAADAEAFDRQVQVFSELAANRATSAYVPELYGVEQQGYISSIIMQDLRSGPNPYTAMDDRLGAGLKLRERVLVMREVVRAVTAMHEAGYAHYDLAPRNIFFRFVEDAEGNLSAEVKLIDFEWSRRLDSPVRYVSRNLGGSQKGELGKHFKEGTQAALFVRENMAVDIEKLGKCFIKFLTANPLHWIVERMPFMNRLLARSLASQVEGTDNSEYIPLIKSIHHSGLQRMLIKMLLPVSAEGGYSDLVTVGAILDGLVWKYFPELKPDSSVDAVIDESTKKEFDKNTMDNIFYRAEGFLVLPGELPRPASFVIKEVDVSDEDELRDFKKESKIFMDLASNPETSAYVPELYEVNTVNDTGSLVMQDLTSGANPFFSANNTDALFSLSADERIFVMREMAKAVKAFHDAGYSHQDLRLRKVFFRIVEDAYGNVRAEVKFTGWQWARRIDEPLEYVEFKDKDGRDAYYERDVADVSKETAVAENLSIDIQHLGDCFLYILAGNPHYWLERRIPAASRLLLGAVEDYEKYIRRFKMFDNPVLQEMILHMLLPSADKGQYESLESIFSLLNDLSFESAPESVILSAA